MRLIDKDALMKDLEKWMKQVDPTHPQEDNAIPPMEDIIVSTLMTIEEQPTIEERKTGKWITDKYGNVLCSECNWCAPKIMAGNISNRHLDYAKPNFCWHCGARLVQEGEDNGCE